MKAVAAQWNFPEHSRAADAQGAACVLHIFGTQTKPPSPPGQARGQPFTKRILAGGADAADGVGACSALLGNQEWNFAGRVLAIGIQRNNKVPPRRRKPRRQRGALPALFFELHQLQRRQLLATRQTVVGGRIIHKNNLKRFASQRRHQLSVQVLQAAFLVMNGHDHRMLHDRRRPTARGFGYFFCGGGGFFSGHRVEQYTGRSVF